MVLGCYRDLEVSRQHPLFDTLAQLSWEPAFQRLLLRGWSQGDIRYFVQLTGGIRPSQRVVKTMYVCRRQSFFHD